jgi:hypothetical protein
MTDDRNEQETSRSAERQDEDPPPESPSQGSQVARSDEHISEMEKGVARVGEEIDAAKEKAEEAEGLDPQPQGGNKDGEQNSPS